MGLPLQMSGTRIKQPGGAPTGPPGGLGFVISAMNQGTWPGIVQRQQLQQATLRAPTNITATQLLLQGIEDLPTVESYQFVQMDGRLPKAWILLDNQLMVNIFYNKALLMDV